MAIFVAFGGNLGGFVKIHQRFETAKTLLLERKIRVVRESPIYQTSPIGPIQSQPDFFNGVWQVETPLAPVPLLTKLLEVESLLGRMRESQGGPRTIDLDLVLYHEQMEHFPGPPQLSIPHPRAVERLFVLVPLRELLGEKFVLPGQNLELGTLIDTITGPTAN